MDGEKDNVRPRRKDVAMADLIPPAYAVPNPNTPLRTTDRAPAPITAVDSGKIKSGQKKNEVESNINKHPSLASLFNSQGRKPDVISAKVNPVNNIDDSIAPKTPEHEAKTNELSHSDIMLLNQSEQATTLSQSSSQEVSPVKAQSIHSLISAATTQLLSPSLSTQISPSSVKLKRGNRVFDIEIVMDPEEGAQPPETEGAKRRLVMPEEEDEAGARQGSSVSSQPIRFYKSPGKAGATVLVSPPKPSSKRRLVQQNNGPKLKKRKVLQFVPDMIYHLFTHYPHIISVVF